MNIIDNFLECGRVLAYNQIQSLESRKSQTAFSWSVITKKACYRVYLDLSSQSFNQNFKSK